MATCKTCGAKTGFRVSTCDDCLRAERARLREQALAQAARNRPSHALEDAAAARRRSPTFAAETDRVVVTTAPSLAGHVVEETVAVVGAEHVAGMSIFSDVLLNLVDGFGGRSETTQKMLRYAREGCLREIKEQAAALGANAVIATSLTYNVMGSNDSVLLIVATGTAVRVRPEIGGDRPEDRASADADAPAALVEPGS
ncbi:MAG: hypothetical protein JWM27_3693 [Gemmatimonadetes bacterium]|nr:hypothetical protein [Gemmatimonadota bacterium]